MLNKDKCLEKLRNMTTQDIAAIVEKALTEAKEGWVECKNCIYNEDCIYQQAFCSDGCYHGESIVMENL